MNAASEIITYSGAALTAWQVLRLPCPLPRWLDIRRWWMLGWVTIETPGYIATAKVHYKPSHWGIDGTRIHTLYIWRDTGQTELSMASVVYKNHCGNLMDQLDPAGCDFLNLILEYFK